MKTIQAGQVIFCKGEQSQVRYAIIFGRVEIIDYKPDADRGSDKGMEKHVGFRGACDFFFLFLHLVQI